MLTLPVLVPFVGAAISLLLSRNYRVQRVVGMTSLAIVLASAIVILEHSRQGPFVLEVGGWAAPVGISLVADPYCITVDFDTLDDNAVTVRERDTMRQERIGIDRVTEFLAGKLIGC